MFAQESINLLTCTPPGADAESFANLLRQNGHSVRNHRVSSLGELRDYLNDRSWDLLITDTIHDEFTVFDLLDLCQRYGVPVIVSGKNVTESQISKFLEKGANDAFSSPSPVQIKHAIVREINAYRCSRQLETLQPKFEEANRRFELLLESAKESIAYVTDGVHINSSKAYAQMFGYDDAADLDGVPQIDLIAADQQAMMKQLLKDHQLDDGEKVSESVQCQRVDGSIFTAKLIFNRATYEDEVCTQVQVIPDHAEDAGEQPSLRSSYSEKSELPETDDDSPKVVVIKDVYKTYMLGQQEVHAVKGVSFNVHLGEFLALAGPSGSGKSTLLNMIGCIDTPSQGTVSVAGNAIETKSPEELADLRANTIGFIFQTFNLLPVLSAWENVEYPLLNSGKFSKAERKDRIASFLSIVGLEKHMHKRPNELSGGQRQRVAIARALASAPSIVLADEPTANLDHKTGEDILELMLKLNQESGTTFVFSTHDAKVMEIASRVITLSDGEIDYIRKWKQGN